MISLLGYVISNPPYHPSFNTLGSSNGPGIIISQDVSIYPTGSNCVDQALDSVQRIHRILLNKIGTAGQGGTGTGTAGGILTGVLGEKDKEKEKGMIQLSPDCGCLRVSLPSIDEAVKVLVLCLHFSSFFYFSTLSMILLLFLPIFFELIFIAAEYFSPLFPLLLLN